MPGSGRRGRGGGRSPRSRGRAGQGLSRCPSAARRAPGRAARRAPRAVGAVQEKRPSQRAWCLSRLSERPQRCCCQLPGWIPLVFREGGWTRAVSRGALTGARSRAMACGWRRRHGERPSRSPAREGTIPKGATDPLELRGAVGH